METDVKAINVTICDDIRREVTGKETLIGVYAGIIIFPYLPADMPMFSTRIEFETGLESADDLTVELRAPDASILLTVTGAMEMTEQRSVQVLSLVCRNVKFQEEGVHTLFFGHKDKLMPIHTFLIKSSGISPSQLGS